VFPLITTPGSKQSIEWLERLGSAKNIEVFRSNLQLYVEYKWRLNKGMVYAFGIFNITYVILMIADCNLGGHSPIMKIFMLIYSILLLMMEWLQLQVCGAGDYFTKFWNYFDFLPQLMYMFYIINHLLNIESSINWEYLHLVCISIIGIRGVTYLRIFSSLRALIRMIIEVLKDIPPFMTIFMISIIYFAVL